MSAEARFRLFAERIPTRGTDHLVRNTHFRARLDVCTDDSTTFPSIGKSSARKRRTARKTELGVLHAEQRARRHCRRIRISPLALGLSVRVQHRPGSEVRRVEQMEQGPARRPALPTVSFAAAGAAAVSLAVVAVPWLRMSFEAPSVTRRARNGWFIAGGRDRRTAAAPMRAALARRSPVVDRGTGRPGDHRAERGGHDRRRRLVPARGALRDGRQPRRHADARDRRLRAVEQVAGTPAHDPDRRRRARRRRRRPRGPAGGRRPGAAALRTARPASIRSSDA